MQDRVPTYPGRVLISPIDGSTPFYAVLTRADEATTPGTPLNKNNLLKDSTALACGFAQSTLNDANVNGAFAKLANRAQIYHNTYTGNGETSKDLINQLPFTPFLLIVTQKSAARVLSMFLIVQDTQGHYFSAEEEDLRSRTLAIHWYERDTDAGRVREPAWTTSDSDPYYALNESGVVYSYVAIGKMGVQ